MRIVISGGWGYGNLGDDAILATAITALQTAFSGCEIDVLTYDLADSAIHAQPGVSLHRCLHSYTDLSAAEFSFRKISKPYGFRARWMLTKSWQFSNSQLWSNQWNFSRLATEIEGIIRDADLFVVAGGGYFNERWMSKAWSHVTEMNVACKFGVPYLVWGITIGNFSEGTVKSAAYGALKNAVMVAVRDEFSIQEMARNGVQARYIPDIALLENRPPVQRNLSAPMPISLGIVVVRARESFRNNLCSAITQVLSQTAGGVRLILSRRWAGDLMASVRFQETFVNAGIQPNVVIPASHSRLEEELANCDLVISENLHGMILATRNHVPIVVINNHEKGTPNYNKIVSFVEQAGVSDAVVSAETDAATLREKIEDAIAERENFSRRAGILCDRTFEASKALLSDLAASLETGNPTNLPVAEIDRN